MEIRAYRIVTPRWVSSALSGEGAKRFGGRWNSPGHRCVYLAESRALAALELLVHLTPTTRTLPLVLIEVVFDTQLVHAPRTPPPDWNELPEAKSAREEGDAWLKGRRNALMRVPSVIMPEESNYLLNPDHTDASHARMGFSRPFSFDPRLMDEGN